MIAFVQLASQQAQDRRGRSKNRDRRIAAKERKEKAVETRDEGEGVQTCGGESAATDNFFFQQIYEKEPGVGGPADETIVVENDEPGTPKGQATVVDTMNAQDVEASERPDQSGKRRQMARRRRAGRERHLARGQRRVKLLNRGRMR